ncbi:MAG: hypothetical protein JWO10_1386, partial [Microbacteriaceae bacterium]|nr:hypothetical protein [Microbacteriaceae bacterium]
IHIRISRQSRGPFLVVWSAPQPPSTELMTLPLKINLRTLVSQWSMSDSTYPAKLSVYRSIL